MSAVAATNVINFRTPAANQALIDHAAEVSGRNRTEFILESSCEKAREVLADQAELKCWLRRRSQVVHNIQRHRQEMVSTLPAIRVLVKKTLVSQQRELAAVDVRMKAPVQAHTTPALSSAKAARPVFQSTALRCCRIRAC